MSDNLCFAKSNLGVKAESAGLIVDLNPAEMKLLAYDGLGLSNTRRLSQRAPGQQGDTDLGFRIDPRFVNLFWQASNPDLSAYYSFRNDILGLFRARDNDPVTITLDFPGGTVRSFDCNIDGSFDFPSDERRHTAQRYGATLKCSDYRLYDPTPQEVNFFLLSNAGGLPIPFTIPVPIGRGPESTVQDINYDAALNRLCAPEYPVMTIFGPIVNPVIENLTTGEKIDLSANGGLTIQPGDFVTVDLDGAPRRDSKTIRDQDGVSQEAFLTTDSDLFSWHLSYNSELLNDGTRSTGVNKIRVSGSNVNLVSRMQMNYFFRYEGV